VPLKDPVARKKYQREWATKHSRRLSAYYRSRYVANPDRWRKYLEDNRERVNATRRAAWKKYGRGEKERARKYGLTVEQLREVLAPGRCAICGRTDRLHVDHCHETGQVRGLLCDSCNAGLGRFRDDEARLIAAANYLRSHRALAELLR
jgi:hypothetical protein